MIRIRSHPLTYTARAPRTPQTYVRAVHSFNPAAGTVAGVDLYVNGVAADTSVAFRGVTNYRTVSAGRVTVGIRAAGSASSTPLLANVTFTAAAGNAYTVGFTGPLAGPTGQVVTGVPPIVSLDSRTVPNPGRFAGLVSAWAV